MTKKIIDKNRTVASVVVAMLLSLAIGYAYGSWATSSDLEEAYLRSQKSLHSLELFFEIGKRSSEPFNSFNLTTTLLEATKENSIGDLKVILASVLAYDRKRVIDYCSNRASRFYRNVCAEKVDMAGEYISKYTEFVE